MLNDQSITSPHNEPQRFPGLFRSSHPRCSVKNVVLKILQISQESTIVGVSFYNVASLQACNFIKKSLQHWCFPVKYANICRTIILKNICERLFLFALVSLEEVKPRQSANRSIFLNVTILFNQMQPYHFYIS